VICSLLKGWDRAYAEGLVAERGLDEVFEQGLLERVEVKADDMWWKTGNLAIEYACRGKLSGISTTEATAWDFSLGNRTHLMVSTERLKALARIAWHIPGRRVDGGDWDKERVRKVSRIVLVRLCDILGCGENILPLTKGSNGPTSSPRKEERSHDTVR
jgi:hypothetical protein